MEEEGKGILRMAEGEKRRGKRRTDPMAVLKLPQYRSEDGESQHIAPCERTVVVEPEAVR